MKQIILTIVVIFYCGVIIKADHEPLIALNLKQFEQIYLGYGNNLSPIFNQTFYNVYDKLAEFETLKGIQPILLLDTLYSQFLPIYAISKQQTNNILKEVQTIYESTDLNGVNFLFRSKEFITYQDAHIKMKTANGNAVTGLLKQIHKIGTITNGEDFSYTHKTMSAPTVDLENFVESLFGFLNGNVELLNQIKRIKNLDVKSFVAQQNNQYAAYLAQVIHNYYSEYTDILENIVKIIDVSVVMLNNLIDSSIQYNTMDISSILGNVIYSSKKLAQIYYECSSMENKLCQSIVNQPDMY